MVPQKFFETPEGQVRAAQLADSGELFSRGTVEHHLVSMLLLKRGEERSASFGWMATQLLDATRILSFGSCKPDSLDPYFKNREAAAKAVADSINPFVSERSEKLAAEAAKAEEDGKKKLLDIIGTNSEFSSLDEIYESLRALRAAKDEILSERKG